MGVNEEIVRNQHETATAMLQARTQVLQQQGRTESEYRRDPKWRALEAKAAQIASRLKRIAAIAKQDAELAAHKAEVLAKAKEPRTKQKSAKTGGGGKKTAPAPIPAKASKPAATKGSKKKDKK